MLRAQVKSSLLKSVGYDPEKRILEVEFLARKEEQKRRVYQYHDVPGNRWAEMMADKSIGGYFLAKIKPDYKCTRIEEEAPQAAPPEAA